MPQQPTIRRARPLDVVNLYRLISEQGDNDLFDLSDEARALAFVLDAIVNGYVLVAESKAHRLVGSIGLMPIVTKTDPPPAGCFWLVISSSYNDSDIAADLLDLSLRAAAQAGRDVHFSRSLPLDDEALTAFGFKANKDGVWVRSVKKSKKNGKAKARKQEEAPAPAEPA